MDTRLKLEKVGVNELLDKSGATFSDFEPAALGGSRQRLDSVATQSCGDELLLLTQVPVLAHGARIIQEPRQPNHSWIDVSRNA
jgi:hypothetical protein